MVGSIYKWYAGAFEDKPAVSQVKLGEKNLDTTRCVFCQLCGAGFVYEGWKTVSRTAERQSRPKRIF